MAAAQRRKKMMIAAVAAILAVGAFVIAFTQLSMPSGGSNAAAPPVTTVQVAVAGSAGLKSGDKLTQTNVLLGTVPKTSLPADATQFFAGPAGMQKLVGSASPQYINVALPAGTPILATMVSADNPSVAFTPLTIQDGYSAISVPFSEDTGAGGYVQAGDHIDIITAIGGTEHYAFQFVHVLKVGSRSTQPTGPTSTGAVAGAGVANMLVLELPQAQANALSYLIDQGSKLRYVALPHDTVIPPNPCVASPDGKPASAPQKCAPTTIDAGNLQSVLDG